MEQKLIYLNPMDIAKNTYNLRTNFTGSKFDELVASIQQSGIIQPILVRPMKKGTKKYELVFGERRLEAAKVVFKTNGGTMIIPALVRELNDSDAYDIMLIENLQREDLTELEEASGFKDYLEKNGEEALVDLSERTGIKPSYIRRRVSVLKLPESILEAWGEGQIRYGYLEQMARLDDEQEILDIFKNIIDDGWDFQTVKELKLYVDDKGIKMQCAVFDLEKCGCLSCNQNSDVQCKLFEIDAGDTRCKKEDCFIVNQKAYLDENWPTTAFYKNFKTNGYRFTDDVDRHQCNIFGHDKRPVKDCFECEAFVTIISGPRLNIHFQKACIGGSDCFKKKTEKKKAVTSVNNDDVGKGEGDKPRVAWHGEFFREEFFHTSIPQRFENLPSTELKAIQLTLFALIKSNWNVKHWFIETYADTDEYYVKEDELFKPIAKMDLQKANDALKAATLQMIMLDDFTAEGRRVIADHIGIDLSREWAITEEYLKKKHIGEILGMGERFGIFSDPKAIDYLKETINKKAFSGCKKTELLKIFLDSGVDLVGKVPDEILN